MSLWNSTLSAIAAPAAGGNFGNTTEYGGDLQRFKQEVQLEVQNMTCGSCYYMVNKVLLDVDGVLEVEFPYAGIAEVLYNDALCLVEDLIEATTKYGYPSTVLEEDEATTEKRRPRVRGRRSIREFLDQLIQG